MKRRHAGTVPSGFNLDYGLCLSWIVLAVQTSVCLADGLVDVADRTSVRMSREAGLMTLDLYPMSISNVDDLLSHFCPVLEAPSEPLVPQGQAAFGPFWPARPERLQRVRTEKQMIIGNENDQVSKGQLVDALACTGDEGRDTLR